MNSNPMKISAALEIISPESFKGPSFNIGARKTARLAKAAGKSIRCIDGAIWLTQEGDPLDHILKAGDSFTVGRDSGVVLSAFGDSRYALA